MKTILPITPRKRSSSRISCFTLVTLLLTASAIVPANDITILRLAQSSHLPAAAVPAAVCCPDDYAPKPAPCVSPLECYCPDSYCPKPGVVLPCPAKGYCPNDYCQKPVPAFCPPATNAWYKCIPLSPRFWLRCNWTTQCFNR